MARVLVVEDNPENMQLASLLPRRSGQGVLCAVDAEAALKPAQGERRDLTLLHEPQPPATQATPPDLPPT